MTISFVGENVEPAEIEEAAGRSNLINQIVVIGQVREMPSYNHHYTQFRLLYVWAHIFFLMQLGEIF